VSVVFAACAIVDLFEARESVARWAVAVSLLAIAALRIAIRVELSRWDRT